MSERVGPITQKFPISADRTPGNSSHLALMGAERVERNSDGWSFNTPLLTRLGNDSFALFVPTSDIQSDQKNLFVLFFGQGAVETQKVSVGQIPVCIGREDKVGSDTILKQDLSVSLHHATIQTDVSGSFVLKNVSDHNSLLVYPSGVFEVDRVNLLASMYPRPDIASFSQFTQNARLQISNKGEVTISSQTNENGTHDIVAKGDIEDHFPNRARVQENVFIPLTLISLPDFHGYFSPNGQVVIPSGDVSYTPYSPAGFIILRSTPREFPRLFVVGFASDDMVIVGRESDFGKSQIGF